MANTDPRTFAGLGSFLLRSLMEEGVVTRDISPERLKNILGTAAHETGFFERLEENLNYRTIRNLKKAGIDAINKLSFTQQRKLLNNPRAFANVAYRNLPGNTAPDDGYKYRGRGFVQLTGKANYKTMGDRLGIDLVESPDLASDPKIAAQIYASWIKKSPVNGKGIENFDSFDSAYKAVNPSETKKQRDIRRISINKYAGGGNIREWADSIFTRLDRTTPKMEIEEAESKSIKSALKQFYDPAFPKERPDDTEIMLADEENKRSLEAVDMPTMKITRDDGREAIDIPTRKIKRDDGREAVPMPEKNSKINSVIDRMRSAFKEKQVQKVIKDFQSTKGLLKALGPSGGSTTSQIEKLARSKDFIKDVDKLPDRSVIKMFYQLGDMIKNFLNPKEDEKQSSNFSLIRKAQASDKFNMNSIKNLSEKLTNFNEQNPDVIGDTSDVAAPLSEEYTGDKIGTAPELQVPDIDNLEATQNFFEPEKQMLLEGMSETIKPPAGSSPDLSRNREPQERSQMTTPRPIDDDPESDERDDFTPNYAIVEGTPMEDANELGYGSTLRRLDSNIDRLRERSETGDMFADEPMPMGGEADPKVDERDDPTDLSFFQRLFSGGFDFDMGRDSEAEENIGADYFYDEPMPMGGEADPRDESDDVIMNFNEGGEVKADFDGKDDEEEPADPPPLAKPKEVADDIPALLSEGEYVLPANVVRYLGVERIIEMHRRVLAEIQQMEDLGMIQNVDENGEPEQDDTEMKFAEGEEPEEGVTKGTIIIASAKPKGMMCPEPLSFFEGGTPSDADAAAAAGVGADPSGTGMSGPEGAGADAAAGTGSPGGGVGGPGPGNDNDPDYSGGFPSIEEELTEEQENLDKTGFGGINDQEMGFYTSPERGTGSVQDVAERGLFGLANLVEDITGYTPTKEDAEAREKSEKEAGQPGDMDFEFKDPEKITEDEIKVDQVIEDLQSKNVYIEGVGYIPLASLMSPRDDIVV